MALIIIYANVTRTHPLPATYANTPVQDMQQFNKDTQQDTLSLSLSRPHSAEVPVVIVCRDAQTKRGEERHTKNTRICRSVTLSTSCWVLYYITANTILLRNLSFFLVFANASCVCVCLVHNNSRIRYHSQIYYPLVYVLVLVHFIHKCFYNRNI